MLRSKTGRPEEYGIPSGAIREFEQRLERLQVRLHGYLMLRGKDIAAEKYKAPYGPETNHRMYSVAKSFTSMAVGMLVKEGKITVEDRICKYFPDKLPEEGVHPWCGEMTIKDMLTMRTCHASTTYKRYGGGDWVESFFRVKPDHVPGTVFSYDTSSPHVLAALVERLSGMDMLDYMRKCALNETGFSQGAYMIKDPYGVSQGGSGLMCTLRDMAGAAYLCCHMGVLDGKELIPGIYMRQAVCSQVPTDLQPALDERQGYGYLFWRARNGGFVMYGMGGQLALCFPALDFCLMTMADTIGSPAGLQMIYDSFYETVFPCLVQKDGAGDGPEAGDWLKQGASLSAAEASLPGGRRGSETYDCCPNGAGLSFWELDWEKKRITFQNPEGIFSLEFAWDGWRRQEFLQTGYRCECRGEWKAGHFLLYCYLTDEEQGHVWMDFAWKESDSGRMSLRMESTGEVFFRHFKGFASAGRREDLHKIQTNYNK